MMAVGVFAGAKKPVIDTASYPGTVAAIGGSPGASGEGCGLVTPNALNLPDFICGAAEVTEGMDICSWPPRRSVIPSELLLYGTCTRLTPARVLNNSIVR